MSEKKIGRPTDNPKPHRITVRLDDDTHIKLNQCCEKLDKGVSEVVRDGIDCIYQAAGRVNRTKNNDDQSTD